MKHLIYITGNLTFAELEAGQVSKVDVLEQLVQNWLLKPAKYLADMEPVIGHNYEHGMSLLALELMFFEPHGQYLSGKDSTRSASKTFLLGFERFLFWLRSAGRIGEDFGGTEAKRVCDWARNGLFHNGHIKDGLLVDIRGCKDQSFYKNPEWEGWLVDPWQLLFDIENYFGSYIQALKSKGDPEHRSLFDSFEKTFDRMVIPPKKTNAKGFKI